MVEARGSCASEFRGHKVSATANEDAGGAYGCVFSHLAHTPRITAACDAPHPSHFGAYYCCRCYCEVRGEASIGRRVWEARLRVVDGAELGT